MPEFAPIGRRVTTRVHARARDAVTGRAARAACLLLLLAFALGARAASPALTIAVGRLPLSLPLYVAQHEGYFEAEQVAVRFADCAFGRICLGMLLDGEVQLATVAESPIVFAAIRGARFGILATLNTARNDSKIVARRSSGVRSAVDLAGKKVGTFVGTTAHYFLHLAMLLGGGDPSDVRLVNLKPDADIGALIGSGALDAVAVFEPYGLAALRVLKDDAKVISSRVYVQTWNLVADERVATEQAENLPRVLRAIERAVEFIRREPAKAQAILGERLGLEPAEIHWLWPNQTYALTLDPSLLHALEGQARWALRFGYVAGDLPDFTRMLQPGPFLRVKPTGPAAR